jgi:hypothetical protein
MALISTHAVVVAGTAPTFAAAASGDTARVGDGLVLVVKNDDVSSKTVTITVPGTLPTGDAYPDKVYTVNASAEAWIPLLDEYGDPDTGQAAIAYSATTSVTRAVVRV